MSLTSPAIFEFKLYTGQTKMKKDSHQGAVAGFDSFTGGIRRFFGETAAEMKRCTWPSRQQLFESTLLVVVNVVILACFVYVVDILAGMLISWITTGSLY